MNAQAFAAVRTDADVHPVVLAPPPLIRIEQISKVFKPRGGAAVTALDAVTLDVARGEIVGIIGRSGAGKSTLVRIVNGLDRPTAGRVTIADVAISELAERDARAARRSIGMVFQHFNLLASRTAAGNIALPLEIAGTPKAEIATRVTELLGLVGLTGERDRYPSELSGGQKQRVGIARALATHPKVLLCDEATSALDPETTQQVLALLRRIRDTLGLTIVLITHEMSVVRSIADSVAVLDGGRIVEQGATFEIFAAPRHPVTRRLVGTVTGAALPDDLRARLSTLPLKGGRMVLRVVFSGPQAGEPVLSRLSRVIGIDVNILSGQVEQIAGRPFGTLVIAVPGDIASRGAVEASLQRLGLEAEVLGYVA
jgi:D-methionine transport system ATP-binding protein